MGAGTEICPLCKEESDYYDVANFGCCADCAIKKMKRLQDLVASLERSVQWRDQQRKMLTAMLRRVVADIPESAWLDKDFYEAVKVAGGGR